MPDTVSIKEYLELKIAYEAAETKHIRELMEERDKALKVQAKEYERRLDDLNGEAGRLRHMQETYMPRELSEEKHSDHIKNIRELNNWKNKQDGMQSRAQWIAIASIIISIVLALIKYKI